MMISRVYCNVIALGIKVDLIISESLCIYLTFKIIKANGMYLQY